MRTHFTSDLSSRYRASKEMIRGRSLLKLIAGSEPACGQWSTPPNCMALWTGLLRAWTAYVFRIVCNDSYSLSRRSGGTHLPSIGFTRLLVFRDNQNSPVCTGTDHWTWLSSIYWSFNKAALSILFSSYPDWNGDRVGRKFDEEVVPPSSSSLDIFGFL